MCERRVSPPQNLEKERTNMATPGTTTSYPTDLADTFMTTEGPQMRRFEDLTRGGQVRRMRRLAETALAAYDLGDVHLTPLMHFFNTTFRIDASSGERYVIRIHRPGSQDTETIQSELIWLLALWP